MQTADRRRDLAQFYAVLAELEQRIGGRRRLSECAGRMGWPLRGVYFFMEEGEARSDSGRGSRIVRVGTHALKAGSRTTLWNRLSQHRGVIKTGGGNHRGSIFRLIVGAALAQRHGYQCPTWGNGSSAPAAIRASEIELEREVSRVIGQMPFVWIPIEDVAGPESMRGYVERNTIALLSNFARPALDSPSESWLGRFSARERVRQSGLWNSNHVDERYDPAFPQRFEQLVMQVGTSA